MIRFKYRGTSKKRGEMTRKRGTEVRILFITFGKVCRNPTAIIITIKSYMTIITIIIM